MSAFGGKADMVLHCKCLLLTQSGHCCTSDIEGAAERAQTLVNKKSRAARSKSNAARPSPTGGFRGSVGHPRS